MTNQINEHVGLHDEKINLSAEDVSLLLLGEHELEAIEIGGVFADGGTNEFLSSVGGSEFGVDIGSGPVLHHGLGTGTTWHLNDNTGQVSVTDEESLTGNLGSLDEDAVKIDNIENNGNFTGEFSFLQQDNTTNFNKRFESL
jgi:hypothetical protein